MTAVARIRDDGPRAAMIALERVVFHPHNVRRNLGDLRTLTASIELHGVLQPVTVEAHGAMLRVRMGHRRVAAARLAGLRRIPALIYPDALDDVEFVYLALHENTVRRDLTRLDRADAILALREAGEPTAAIVANLGSTAKTVASWVTDPSAARVRRNVARTGSATYGGYRVPSGGLKAVLRAWAPRLAAGLTPAQGVALLAELVDLTIPRAARRTGPAPTTREDPPA